MKKGGGYIQTAALCVLKLCKCWYIILMVQMTIKLAV